MAKADQAAEDVAETNDSDAPTEADVVQEAEEAAQPEEKTAPESAKETEEDSDGAKATRRTTDLALDDAMKSLIEHADLDADGTVQGEEEAKDSMTAAEQAIEKAGEAAEDANTAEISEIVEKAATAAKEE